MTMLDLPTAPTAPAEPMQFPLGSSNLTKKNYLLGRISDGTVNLEILGWLIFWNVREVEITRDKFAAALGVAGLDSDYAKEHNARSALVRALNSLKEQKIVRTVNEDSVSITFQFTAEVKVGQDHDARLSYHPEVIITVDKEHYGMFKDFRTAITKVDDPKTGLQSAGAEQIKDQLAAAFEREKNSYKSSDITRYIQNILQKQADIVSLRPQGSIYFVPAAYGPVIDSLKMMLAEIGGDSRFDAIPLPDVKDVRKTVGDSFAEEVASILGGLDKEVADMNSSSKEITEKWISYRKEVIRKVKARIDMYSELLGDKAGELAGSFDAIEATLRPRILDLT